MNRVQRARMGAAAALSAAAIVASLVGGVASATAAGPEQTLRVAPTAWAPTCVKLIDSGKPLFGWPWAKIRNDCSYAVRVKVIWAHAPDSACKSLAKGATYKSSTGILGRFDGIKNC